jgi:hypothetical protein
MLGHDGVATDCWGYVHNLYTGQGAGHGATTAAGGSGGSDDCGDPAGSAGSRGGGGHGGRGGIYECCSPQGKALTPPVVGGGGGGGGGGFFGGGGAAGGEANYSSAPASVGPETWIGQGVGAAGGGGGSSFGPSGAVFRTGAHNGSGVVTVTYTPGSGGGPKPPTTTTTATATTTTSPTTTTTTTPTTTGGATVTVTAGEPRTYTFKFSTPTQPKVVSDMPATELAVPTGEVTFEVTNSSSSIVSHSFEVCTTPLPKAVTTLAGVQALPNSCSGPSTPVLAPGGTGTLTIDLTTPGAYEYLSTANNPDGDAFSGMKGVLNVT